MITKQTEYIIGKTLREDAVRHHISGYYLFPNLFWLRMRWNERDLAPEDKLPRDGKVAIIECKFAGKVVSYGDKFAASSVTPLRVLEVFDVQP